MKRIMAFLAMLMLVLPFANVNAITGNYYVYGPGDEVNFYTYEGDPVGTRTTILSDEGAESQYVKVLATGFNASSSIPYAEQLDIDNGALTDFTKSSAYRTLLSQLESAQQGVPYAKPIEEAGNLSLITLDELKTVFGATLDGDKYVIDVATWGKHFEAIQGSKAGMYTQTIEGTDVWVVKWTEDANRAITAITVEKEPVTSTTTWELVPVLYLDKTYDCLARETGKEYACYSCDEDYTWTEVGSQADTCVLVENINAKADCVKSPQTGVEDYIIPFTGIVILGALALTVVNKKDLFRGI